MILYRCDVVSRTNLYPIQPLTLKEKKNHPKSIKLTIQFSYPLYGTVTTNKFSRNHTKHFFLSIQNFLLFSFLFGTIWLRGRSIKQQGVYRGRRLLIISLFEELNVVFLFFPFSFQSFFFLLKHKKDDKVNYLIEK